MAVSGSGEIKLRDIYNEQQETTGEPADNTNISMDTLADSYGGFAASTVTSRATLSGDEDKITDFYGAVFPGTFHSFLLYRGSFGNNELDGVAANDDDSVIVEGEVVVPHAVSTYDLVGTDNATFEITTTGGASLSPEQSDDSNEVGNTNFFSLAAITLSPENDTYDGTDMKFRVYDTNNTSNGNFGDKIFRFFDKITGHTTSEIGPSGNTAATKIMYIDTEDESVGDIYTSHTTTVGTIRSSSYSRAVNVNGDGGNINHSDTGEFFTIGNTPGKMTFSYIHWQYPYTINSSSPGTRNKSTNTAVLDIRYNRAIDSISRNASTYNSGDTVTISATGEGVSGVHTMRLGYHKDTGNDTFTASTDESVLESLYLRQDETENFTLSLTTGTALRTYYPKALYTTGTSNRVTGAAFTLAPAYSYSTTGNTTINVSTTQVFAVSNVIGYNSAVVITSSPNIGGGTDSATMTPLLKTGTFTITFNAAADYGQNGASYDQTDILSVDPTVSVVLTDNQAGDNIPITDAHSDTIASATHGISPTIFTHTPSVAGTLQNGNALTYLWTAASSYFTYTSGGTATAGAVSFKKNSSGTRTHLLTVTGDNDRDASAGSSVVCQSVTKTVSGASIDVLRIGTTFTVTSISTAYTQTVALYRQAVDDGYYKIANGVSVASTIHFSMTGDAWIPDSTARTVRLVDDDNTNIYDGLGSFVILNPLPEIDSFIATQSTILGRITLSWQTTGATTVSINQSVGSQGSMDGSVNDNGNANNTSITYTLTAGNSNSETVTAEASATTINPTLTLAAPDVTSWTWGDTGNVTLVAQKNFYDGITGHMGYNLTNASGTSGTELQTIIAGNSTVNTNFNVVFEKNDWDYQSSLGSAIVDFRIGHNDALWALQNNAATVNDFTGPNAATSFSAIGSSATGIQISWTNPSGTFTGVKLYGNEEGLGLVLLTTILNGNTPSFSHSGLTAELYEYYLQTYYSRTADSTTRTKTVNTTTFQGSVIGWDSHLVYGLVMLSTQGTGYTNQEDAYHHASSESRTLYHLDTQVFGTHTVSMRRAEDGGTFNGNNTWFSTGEGPDVFYLTTSGNVTAANYILEANVQPDSPTGADATAHNVLSQITITWACTSTIETGFKIYRSTSSTPNNSGSPIVTLGANVTTYTNTGLDAGQIYYYSVYSYHGTAYGSSAASDSDTTAASAAWGAAPTDFSIEGLPFQTITSAAKSITITGADTSNNGTTVSCTGGVAVALSQSAGSGYGSFLASSSITTTSSDTIYAKFRFTFPKAGVHVNFTSDVTYENGGVTNTDLDIDVDASIP